MMRSTDGLRLLAMVLLTGCASEQEALTAEAVAVTMNPIVDGVDASEYPEAAYLDIDPSDTGMYVCSGTLISPSVILTAGHCVDGHSRWDVHVAGAYRLATRSAVYDWDEQGATGVNPAHHDIALVFLDEPIQLHRFPTIARSAVAENSKVTCVGRVQDGHINSSLYRGDTEVSLGGPIGYPLDYQSDVVIQSGDSGGPVFRYGTHEIIAVNSGVGADLQVLARVDLLAGWIGVRLAAEDSKMRLSSPAHASVGGMALASDETLHDSDVSQVQNSVDSAHDLEGVAEPPSEYSGPHARMCASLEAESNDSFEQANPVGGALCGSLMSGMDSDWFTLDLEAGNHHVELAAVADATMHIGIPSSAGCLLSYTNVKAVDINVSGGTAKVCLLVRSAQRLAQSYVVRSVSLAP